MDVRQIATDGLERYYKYIVDNPDPHLDHDYLKPLSIVMDVGGYHGDWTAAILRKYGSFVSIFEPIKENIEILNKRFQNDFRVNICPVALEDRDTTQDIFVDGDRSSLFVGQGFREAIVVQDIGTYPISGAHLISLNCEGSEYKILLRMIQAGIISRFKNIQVQFHHDVIPNAFEMRDKIRLELSKTHVEQYCFPFVWESWKRKY